MRSGQGVEVLSAPEAQDREASLILVFVPRHYPSISDFETDVDILMNALRSTKPFNEFPGVISNWKMNVSPGEEETFFATREDFPPIKVEAPFLELVHNEVGANYKLVILDRTGGKLCAELSFLGATSPVLLGRVASGDEKIFIQSFLHELGHSLGLRDESSSSVEPIVPGPPNCAPDQKKAEMWWGDLAGKIYGVSYYPVKNGCRRFFKPTFHSVMENPNRFSDYGPVSERYLRKVLREHKPAEEHNCRMLKKAVEEQKNG